MKEAETTTRLEGVARQSRTRRGRRSSGRRTPAIRTGGTQGSPLEQFLKENASSLTFLGVTLGVFVSRKFLVLPVAVALMLAQKHLGMAGLERARELVRR